MEGKIMNWRTSTQSSSNGGECVEVASDHQAVMIRDTKNRDGGLLAFSTAAWERFTKTL